MTLPMAIVSFKNKRELIYRGNPELMKGTTRLSGLHTGRKVLMNRKGPRIAEDSNAVKYLRAEDLRAAIQKGKD